MPPVNDFTYYWYAAQQFVSGHNPYLAMPGKYVMFAPPWALAVTFPLGFLPFQVAQFLWFLVLVTLVFVSAIWLWELYGEGRSPTWAMALCVTFIPVLFNFMDGQIDALILLGIAGFLRYERKRPYLAGAFLFLCALKPQIVFLIWPVLLWRAVFQRYWRPLVSFTAVLASFNLAIMLSHPQVFREYFSMLQTAGVLFYDTATLASMLRHITGIRLLQYAPAAATTAWLLCYGGLWREDWNWRERTPELVLISLVAAPYAWYADHLLVIPALFVMLVRVLQQPKYGLLLAMAYFSLNAIAARETVVGNIPSSAWVPLGWLMLYAFIVAPWRNRATSEEFA